MKFFGFNKPVDSNSEKSAFAFAIDSTAVEIENAVNPNRSRSQSESQNENENQTEISTTSTSGTIAASARSTTTKTEADITRIASLENESEENRHENCTQSRSRLKPNNNNNNSKILDYFSKMSSTFRGKTRPFPLTFTLLAIVICLWLCVVFFLVISETREDTSGWSWVETGAGSGHGAEQEETLNTRPIIGVLAQEYKYYSYNKVSPHGMDSHSYGFVNNPHSNKESSQISYIAASYVKFIEGAGARVVPILVNGNTTYLRRMFQSVNGILFPGGAVPFNTSQYGEAGRLLYKLAIEANNNGNFFPIWGTCLGFEFMLYTEAGSQEIRADCGAWNVVNRLKFTDGASKSRLFGNARKSVISALGTKETTVNFHHFCVTQENFTKYKLDQSYRILSVNYDSSSKLTYVSSVESKKYPFYAVQFHPEKNLYEWTTKENIPHSREAIESAQYFADFFVAEARKNKQKFESAEEEQRNLIYNYNPDYTGASKSTFEQLYFFAM